MFGQSLLSAFGSAACTTDTDQLFTTNVQTTSLATYQLNNATTSIPSNTYPGTASNITYTAGKFGNAAVFNGSSSHVDFTSPIPDTNTAASFSCWFNMSTLHTSGYKSLIGAGNMTTGAGILSVLLRYASAGNYYIEPSRAFSSYTYYTATSNYSTVALSANTWYNIVFTYETSKQAKIYLNGVLVSTTSLTTTSGPATNSGVLALGQYRDSISASNWNGLIDQVRIFNSVLPQVAVTALYNETTTTATYDYVEYETPNPNSVAYYKMSDATDQLGNYNGTATNVNFNTEGKFGFAGAFNGSNADIDLPSNIDSTTMSISFWIYIDSIVTGNEVVIELENGYGVWFLANAGGKLGMQSSNANSAHTLSNSQLSAGSWHHVAAVWNSGSRTFYIDNTVQSGGSVTDYLTCNENTIGSRRSGEFFDGKIDQIRIYDSAISAANVTTLYNEIECPAVAVTNAFNTVIYSGTNSNHSITTGFKPGLIWMKNRSSSANHALFDSVRGTEILYSNLTNAQSSWDSPTFDSNGFTLSGNNASSSLQNASGSNYVSWNWKATLANLSTGFNGSSSIITLPTALSDGTTTVANCISFWFNVGAEVTSSTTNNEIMTFAYSGGSSGKIALGSTTGNFSGETFSVSSDVTTQYTYSTTNIPAGWNHAVVQWNSGTTKWDIYINGVAHTTYTFGTNEQGNFALKFGQRSSFYFNGSLNQIRLFNSILSASEISDLYAEPLESNNTLNYPAGAGCIAAYPLQTDAVDLSGNYNGTPSNVTFSKPGYLTQNTEGTIPSTVATNVDAGFSIVKYTGNSTNNATVGTGLSSASELVIVKDLDNSQYWCVGGSAVGDGENLYLNETTQKQTRDRVKSVQTNTFTLGSHFECNGNNVNFIAYCFHSIPGYSRVGSYTGTGGNQTIYVGFEPRFVLIKRATGGSLNGWVLSDSKRGAGINLFANTSGAEANETAYGPTSFTSSGFTLAQAGGNTNISGSTYIFMAIA